MPPRLKYSLVSRKRKRMGFRSKKHREMIARKKGVNPKVLTWRPGTWVVSSRKKKKLLKKRKIVD